nr:hypothetical protein [Tanacetum cinerariifolium]
YDWSFQPDEEPINYALMAFSSLSCSSDNELRDNALIVLRQNLKKAEQERNDLKLKLEKFQTSSKNLSELLASQTNAKICLSYNSQVFTHAMFDYDDYLSPGSDERKEHGSNHCKEQCKRGTHKQYAQMTLLNLQRQVVPAAVLTQSKLVLINDVRPGNPQHALENKGVIDSGFSRHITGNMSYLSNFVQLNGGYVTFGGNP